MSTRDYNHRRFFRGIGSGGGGGGGGGTSSRSASMSSTNTASSNSGGSSSGRGVGVGTTGTLLDTTNTSNSNSAMMPPSTPPRVVTPSSKDSSFLPDSPLLHKPTATSGGGLTHSSPLKPTEPMRYSLNGGNNQQRMMTVESRISQSPSSPVKNHHHHHSYLTTPSATKATTAREMMSASSNNKLKAAHSLALQSTTTMSSADLKPTNKSSLTSSTAPAAAASSRVLSSSSKLLKQDPNAYKIFLLLLQPQSKIFELIQLIYSPNDTTIGQILELIPHNATEQALGHQTYVGLCRPKTQQELLDKDQLASEARPGMEGTANITLGEILVAIPQGYNGADVASLSKQILSNPKIVKLLKRADPLAPKNRRRRRSSGAAGPAGTSSSSSRRHQHKSSSSKSRILEQVHVLEKHDEVEEEHMNYGGGGGGGGSSSSHQQDDYNNNNNNTNATSASRSASMSSGPGSIMNKKEAERLMQMAMEHAAAEAAAANAAIPGGATRAKSILIHRSASIGGLSDSHEGSMTTEEEDDFSSQESLDASFSSWSKSFDASFSAQTSICSGVSKRALRRKDRQARRMRILQRSAVAVFGLMIVFYIMDPSKDDASYHQLTETTTRTPMGFRGILQCLFLLLTLYKVERLIRTTTTAAVTSTPSQGENGGIIMPAIYMSEERRCPFLKAAGRALKRFKHKYGKQLFRKGGSGGGRHDHSKKQQQQQGGLVASGQLQEDSTATHVVHHHHHQKLRSFSLKSDASSLQG